MSFVEMQIGDLRWGDEEFNGEKIDYKQAHGATLYLRLCDESYLKMKPTIYLRSGPQRKQKKARAFDLHKYIYYFRPSMYKPSEITAQPFVTKQKTRNHFYEYSPSKSSESSEMLEVVWTT
ncbi:hypothetical protein YC2023_045275 [Brassica napus]